MISFKNRPFLNAETDIQTQVFSDFARDYLDAVLELNSLSKEEIVSEFEKDPDYLCKIVKRGFCKILIN